MHTYTLTSANITQEIPEDTEYLIIDTCMDCIQTLRHRPLKKLKCIDIADRQSVFGVLSDGCTLYKKPNKYISYVSYSTQTLDIPDWIQYIYPHAVQPGSMLQTFRTADSNPCLSADGGLLMNKAKTQILCCAPTVRELTIPESVEEIESIAFLPNKQTLEKIIIPEESCLKDIYFLRHLSGLRHLVLLSDKKHYHMLEIAENSSVLETITIAPDSRTYKLKDGVLYNYDMTELYRCVCTKTGSFAIPDSVQQISSYAFANTRLTHLAMKETFFKQGILLLKSDTLESLSIQKKMLMKYGRDNEHLCFLYDAHFEDEYTAGRQMIVCCKNLKRLFVDDISFGTEITQSYLPYLQEICSFTGITQGSDYITPKRAFNSIIYKNKNLLLPILMYCYHLQPDETILHMKGLVKNLAVKAIHENNTDFLSILLDRKQLKKQHLDILLPMSIEKQNPKMTIMLIEYKKANTRWKDPSKKLLL